MPRLSWLHRKRQETSSVFAKQSTPITEALTVVNRHDSENIQPRSRKSLWDAAYDDLRNEKSDLVIAFEMLLLSEPSIDQMHDVQNVDSMSRERQMSALIDNKLAIMNQKQWRFKLGGKSIEVREQIDRIVKVVLVAKDFISGAAALDPLHPGIPWAGVCVLLPLIVNDKKQRDAATDGLEYVTQLVRRYGEIERIYLGPATDSDDLLRPEVLKLYKRILEYQANAACQYNRPTGLQIVRNTIELDSWQAKLEEIKALEATCDKVIEMSNITDHRTRMKRLEEALQSQESKVSAMLELSRAQDLEQGQLLLGELRAVRQDQQEWRRDSDEAKCLKCLRTTDYESNKNKNPDRIPGTCEWFLRHPKYQSWLEESRSSWLWVTADPGCGKSVLSKYLSNIYARNMPPNTSVCYYFFKDDSVESRSALHALCAILHQLLSQRVELIDHAVLEYLRNGDKLSTLFDTMWSVFCSTTADERCGRVVCILDALDECEGSTRLLLVERLSRYYSRPNEESTVKFIVTSRPNTSIGDTLWIHGQDPASIQLMGESEEEKEAIAIEINLVIKEKVKQFNGLRQRRGVHDDAATIIQTHLDGIENRTYLWVALIFPELEKNAGSPKKHLLKLIKLLPATVDEAYERILNQSRDFTLARRLLHIIVASTRPLTLSEMNIALSIREGEIIENPSELEAEASFKITIRELCGLFVNVKDRRIYLIHQTAKEFLITTKKPHIVDPSRPSWKHSLNAIESGLVLAKICTAYLLQDCFTQEPSFRTDWWRLKNEVTYYLLQHQFLDYAAKNWSSHVIAAEYRENLVEAASTLCNTGTSRFKTWFQFYWQQFNNDYSRGRCPRSYTDFMAAADTGHLPVLQRLYENGYYHHPDTKLWLPLWCAAIRGHSDLVNWLLGRVPAEAISSMGVWRALHAAVFAGSVESTKLLLNKVGDLATQVDPIAKFDGGWSLLHRAAHNGHEEVVRLLLGQGADITAKSSEMATALDAAGSHESVAQLLRSKGATSVSPIDWKSTPVLVLNAGSPTHQNQQRQPAQPPSIGDSIYFNEICIKQMIEMDDNEEGSEFSLSLFNAFIREVEEEAWKLSDAYISRNLGVEMCNRCHSLMELAATAGFQQISRISSKMYRYANHKVEPNDWTETDFEIRTISWVSSEDYVDEPDDDVCFQKLWTALSELRSQLPVATRLLQNYYDQIAWDRDHGIEETVRAIDTLE